MAAIAASGAADAAFQMTDGAAIRGAGTTRGQKFLSFECVGAIQWRGLDQDPRPARREWIAARFAPDALPDRRRAGLAPTG